MKYKTPGPIGAGSFHTVIKPEQVEAWLNEQYPAIHAEAKAENAEIFWGDETAVQNKALYTWK